MPQPRRQKLEPDRVVEALVPDPAAGPPDAAVLRGFLGRSPDDGVWRLYVTAALDEYVDIPEAEILHSEKLPDDGGTVLWVRRTLELHYARVQSQRVQAEFLGGPITAAGAAARAAAPGPQPVATFGIACPSVVTRCPSDFVPCQSDFAPCVSVTGPCPSRTIPCESVVTIRCPSRTSPCDSWLPIRCQSTTIPCESLQTVRCPSRTIPCDSWIGVRCPSATIPCDSLVANRCPSGFVCPSEVRCPSEIGCPSEVRCPSMLGCPTEICGGGGGFDPIP